MNQSDSTERQLLATDQSVYNGQGGVVVFHDVHRNRRSTTVLTRSSLHLDSARLAPVAVSAHTPGGGRSFLASLFKTHQHRRNGSGLRGRDLETGAFIGRPRKVDQLPASL